MLAEDLHTRERIVECFYEWLYRATSGYIEPRATQGYTSVTIHHSLCTTYRRDRLGERVGLSRQVKDSKDKLTYYKCSQVDLFRFNEQKIYYNRV